MKRLTFDNCDFRMSSESSKYQMGISNLFQVKVNLILKGCLKLAKVMLDLMLAQNQCIQTFVKSTNKLGLGQDIAVK